MAAKKKSLKNLNLKTGDKIVDFGQIFRIFKIEKKKNAKGQEEKIIFFKPQFPTKKNKGMVCSLPLKNLSLTKIRKPVSLKKMKKLLKKLAQKEKERKPVNTARAKDKLKSNDPETTTSLLKRLFLDKQDQAVNFTSRKRSLFKKARRRFMEEAALVLGLSPSQAKKKILQALKKGAALTLQKEEEKS